MVYIENILQEELRGNTYDNGEKANDFLLLHCQIV